MIEDKHLSIIDYGSSKIRFGVYDNLTKNKKFIEDKNCLISSNESESLIQDLIQKKGLINMLLLIDNLL